jgi:hypothetical protein
LIQGGNFGFAEECRFLGDLGALCEKQAFHAKAAKGAKKIQRDEPPMDADEKQQQIYRR